MGEHARRPGPEVAWREAPYYTDAERAALALAEAATRLSDRADLVPDGVWEEAARHYSEQEPGALVIAIGLVKLWNRVNVCIRQIPDTDSIDRLRAARSPDHGWRQPRRRAVTFSRRRGS